VCVWRTIGLCWQNHEWKVHEWNQITHYSRYSLVGLALVFPNRVCPPNKATTQWYASVCLVLKMTNDWRVMYNGWRVIGGHSKEWGHIANDFMKQAFASGARVAKCPCTKCRNFAYLFKKWYRDSPLEEHVYVELALLILSSWWHCFIRLMLHEPVLIADLSKN
jgi:hypothetical protein